MEIFSFDKQKDSWHKLNLYTTARIALGKVGVSIPIKENLHFKMAHARARDAVYAILDKEKIICGLNDFNFKIFQLRSKVIDRKEYLLRPDFGRSLNDSSIEQLNNFPKNNSYDICINIADGLSANAVNVNVLDLMHSLVPLLIQSGYSLSPICLIEHARVAISDETGMAMNAKMSIIILGERPGLSSTDSIGVYITYNPQKGNTDESRNCVSNIRANGLDPRLASEKILQLIQSSFHLKYSGVELKECSNNLL